MKVLNLTNLLVEAAEVGDDVAVQQILREISVEDACKLETRSKSRNFGCNALHKAKTPAVAQLLLNFGVDANSRGNKNQTPLHTCCDNAPVMRILLENGAKLLLTTDGSTALEWAVVADSIECAKLLIAAFPEAVNIQNDNGNTPLHLVASKRMTELLLKHGARVSAENKRGQIPLESAMERVGDSDNTAITELLLDVSEERGLKFRSAHYLLSETGSADGGWEAPAAVDAKAAATATSSSSHVGGKRWNLVREHFLTKSAEEEEDATGSKTAATTARPRLGALVSEWNQSSAKFGSLRSIIRATSLTSDKGAVLQHSDYGALSDTGGDGDEDEEEADEHCDFYRTFFEMAISERPHLALRMLNRHRTFAYAKGTARVYTYDFSLLGGIDKSSAALRLMVENDRKELVSHDLCQWLLNAKWILFSQSQLIEEGVFYAVFMALTILYTLVELAQPLRFVVQVLVMGLALRFFFRFGFEAKHRIDKGERGVFRAIAHAEKFTGGVFFLTPLCILLHWTTDSVDTQYLEMLASLMLWIRVLYFLEAFNETTGLAMRIVRTMMADISVYLFVQLIFVLAFAHGMTIAFRTSKAVPSEFANFGASFTTLFFFVFNLDVGSIFNEPDFSTRLGATLLLACFESLVVLLIVNLLVAVMSSSFDRVMSEAKEEWLLVRAKICIRMEDQMMVNFGSTLARQRQRIGGAAGGAHHAHWARKRKFLVKERADGKNCIAVPREMLPEEHWMLHLLRKLGGKTTLCQTEGGKRMEEARAAEEKEPVEGFKKREKPVEIGIFDRTSKHTSSSSNNASVSTEHVAMTEDLAQLSDDKLVETMKNIVHEMESRRQRAAAVAAKAAEEDAQ